MKVAVIGASGFLGQAVVEQLNRAESCDVRAVVHSSGNAWALVSAGVPLHFADLSDSESVGKAVKGCTHVVNCSRGGPALMTRGLANLLEESLRAGVQRLVHISSVAVYGSQPATAALTEDAPLTPDTDYGVIKLSQDRQVIKARKKGLETIILCPPNIGGAGSPYLDEVYGSLAQGEFAFVDNGAAPLDLVDVHNLAHAVRLALTCPASNRHRYFVTDESNASWADTVALLETKFDRDFGTTNFSSDEIANVVKAEPSAKRRLSLLRALKHMVSSDVRFALRRDPLWERVDKWIRSVVAKFPGTVEDRLRLSVEGAISVPAADYLSGVNKLLCEQQLKNIRYSCAVANKELGYRPLVSFEKSVDAFTRWRLADNALEGYVDLLNELES